jgi:hypothetical protein
MRTIFQIIWLALGSITAAAVNDFWAFLGTLVLATLAGGLAWGPAACGPKVGIRCIAKHSAITRARLWLRS